MKNIYSALIVLFLLSLAGCAQADENKPMQKKSIGIAEMASDGTITLHLRAEGVSDNAPAVGDAIFIYKKDNPKYKEILQHLGGMKPGDTKDVPPWDESK